jgi:hypothetical protein
VVTVIMNIRSRRRLAAAVVVAFVVLSGAITWTATREYSPEALSERAAAAFRDATSHHVTLGEARVSVEDLVTIEGANVIEDGKSRVSAERVIIAGVPRPLSSWRPDSVRPEKVSIEMDLDDPGGRLEGVRLLAALVDRMGDIDVVAPQYLTVKVSYGGLKRVPYFAPSAIFLADKRLDIITPNEVFAAPPGAAGPRPYVFTAAADAVTLSAPLDYSALPLARAVAQGSGAATLERLEGGADARFSAVWTADDATVTFTSSGWRLRGPAAETLGPNIPQGKLDVTITSFVMRNDRFDSSDGVLEFAADKAETAAVARWLEAFGLVGLAGAPKTLENVRIAAVFRVSGDAVSIHPVPGRPALIWLDSGRDRSPLFSGSGAAPLSELRSLAGAAPSPKSE